MDVSAILTDFTGMGSILMDELNSWLTSAVKAVPNVAVALIVIIFTYLFSIGTGRLLKRMLPRMTRSEAVQRLTINTTRILVFVIGLFIALGILNLDKAVTSLLAGAGVIGIALGFAFQEIASNFISGIMIAFREPYRVGDIVQLDTYTGRVSDINLRATTMITFDGLHVVIPNKDMFTKVLINYTITDERRMELRVGVSYAEDLRHVTETIKEAVQDVPGRLPGMPVDVFFEEFSDSSIVCVVHVWVNYNLNKAFLQAKHLAVIQIKEAFNREGITIPFPIRTLDFGIKGGEKVDERLQNVFTRQ